MKLFDHLKLSVSKLFCKLKLFEIYKTRHKDRFLILTYHRILKEGNSYFRPGQYMTETAFEAHLEYLNNNANVLSLREVLSKLDNGEQLDANTVVITFDDGYVDVYTVAFPLLKKYNLPATIFLTTGPIDTSSSLWWDRLEAIIRFSQRSKELHDLEKMPFKRFISKSTDFSKFAIHVNNEINKMNRTDRDKFMIEINNWIQRENVPEPKNSMLKWNMIQEMIQYQIDFECHTVNHKLLDELESGELMQEVIPAKHRIKEITGQPADIFACPLGRKLNNKQESILRKEFRAICYSGDIGYNHVNRINVYRLKRKDAGFLLLNNEFQREYFEFELSGFTDSIRFLKKNLMFRLTKKNNRN